MTHEVVEPAIRMRIVATAGHVDHGKSTLVHALTGMQPDRLAEERRRGLTIDLGFSWTHLPRVGWAAFVDVPGHVDFIRNMIAGTAVIQACLLVVDAREGWRAQTEEHLRILEFAGVRSGLTVITKRSLVDDTRAADVVDEVRRRLDGSFLATCAIVTCDAVTGSGVDELRSTLDDVLAAIEPPPDRGRPRLWIDRSFVVSGAGTIVTGGLAHGSLRPGDHVEIVGSHPVHTTRIRGLEALGKPREIAVPGSRTAANLANTPRSRVKRGDALVKPGDWHLTSMIDVELSVLRTLNHPVDAHGSYLVYVGSGEQPVRLQVLQGRRVVDPGATALVRLRLTHALPLVPGDRFVLRETGRSETVGGGTVLDVAPVVKPSRATRRPSATELLRERGWVEADEFERLTGQKATETSLGDWLVDDGVLQHTRTSLLEAVKSSAVGIDVARLDKQQRAVLETLVNAGELQVSAGIALTPEQAVALHRHPFVLALDAQPFAPPTPSECGVSTTELAALTKTGAVISEGGFYFSRNAIERARQLILSALDASPEGITVSQARAIFGVSRKWTLPLLAILDRRGITRRMGDKRVKGPYATT